MNESEIFLAASQIENQRLRAAFLSSVCGDDPQLHQRMVDMLERFEAWEGAADSFVESLPERVADIRQQENESRSASGKLSTASSIRSSSFVVGDRLQHYTIQSCLGVGGMGEVYLAVDEHLSRKVALKMLPPHRVGDEAWSDRFHREAQTVSALNHPNILTVFEIGRQDNHQFMVTEFVEGRTLRRELESGTLDLVRKLRVAIQVAHALEAAHRAGIIHRDLKPDNVMVRPDGIVKVLDFGLAKHMSGGVATKTDTTLLHSKTDPAIMLGTLRYMSPEQVRRQTLDYRSDIFSFGILLYELLSGRLPFQGATDADFIAAVLYRDPAPLDELDLPAELKRLVLTMLRKDRETRLISAREVSVELDLILEQASASALQSPVKTPFGTSTPGPIPRPGLAPDDFQPPEVRYARSGDVNIAYQVLGSGELDIVFVMGWVSHLDWFWKEPGFARFLRRLASFSRLILFDKRGTGLSDRVPADQLPTLEQRMEDVHAVMDAVGSDRAVLCGVSEGGPMSSLFAATYPHRTTALIMIGCYARRLQADDYPWGPTEQQHARFLEDIRKNWGGPVGIEARAPSRMSDPDFRSWWATYLRMGASPGAVLALTRMNSQIDVRPILKTIQVPTLVIHRQGDQCLKVEEGHYLAEHIPGARFVELGGTDHLPFVGNQEEILQPIEQFLTGVTHDSHIRRVLATVLFVEFIRSGEGAGSNAEEIARSHALRQVQLYRGQLFAYASGSTGRHEPVTATFDGPARAIRAGMAICDSAIRLGVTVRIGVHTGECDTFESTVRGPAVESAAWVAGQSALNRILISSTVKDLVAGADLRFQPYGTDRTAPPHPSRLFVVES